MPIYFFHLTEGDRVVTDLEGIECPDMAGTQKAAIKAASSLIAEAVRDGDCNYRGRINVEDAGASPVLTVTFGSHVQIDVMSRSDFG